MGGLTTIEVATAIFYAYGPPQALTVEDIECLLNEYVSGLIKPANQEMLNADQSR